MTPADLTALIGDVQFTRHTLAFGELVTLSEASGRIGKPESTLRRWLSEGRFVEHGRLGKASLVGWGDVVETEYLTRRRKPRTPAQVLDNTEQMGCYAPRQREKSA